MSKRIFFIFLTIFLLASFIAASVSSAPRFEEAREEFFKKVSSDMGQKVNQNQQKQSGEQGSSNIAPLPQEGALELENPAISYKISGKLLNLTWEKISGASYYEIFEKIISKEGIESEIVHKNSNNFFTRPELNRFLGSKLYYKVRAAGGQGTSGWSNEAEVNLILDFPPAIDFGKIPTGMSSEKIIPFESIPEINFSIYSAESENSEVFRIYVFNKNSGEKIPFNFPVAIEDKNKRLLVEFIPKDVKLYESLLVLSTEAGNFEIWLAAEGIPIPQWHTYSGSGNMFYYDAGIPVYKLRDFPHNPLLISSKNDAASGWISIADNNGGEHVIYRSKRDFEEGELWQYMPVQNISGITAAHESSDGKMRIGAFQIAGGKKIHKLLSGFEGKFSQDESFTDSEDEIISIFSSPQGRTYVLSKKSLKLENIGGGWSVVCEPDEFFDKEFTQGVYLNGEDASDGCIYLGTSVGSLVKLNSSGKFLSRRLSDLDKQQYDSWKKLYENAIRQGDMYSMLYNWASGVEKFAQKLNMSRMAAYVEPQVKKFGDKVKSFQNDADMFLEKIIAMDNYRNEIKELAVDSSGRVWIFRGGEWIIIKSDGKQELGVDLDKYNNQDEIKLLLPETADYLIEEFANSAFTIEDIISGDVIGKSEEIAVRDEYFTVLY